MVTLPRGTEVRVLEGRDGYFKVSPPKGEDVWLEGDAFERLSDRKAREARSALVESFSAERGRAIESCPILLAPAYGSARWGELEDGDDVEVILADHDFYGVRLPGQGLGFVPARSLRLLPSAATNVTAALPGARSAPRSGEAVSSARPVDGEDGSSSSSLSGESGDGRMEPLVSLPAGAEPPQLMTRVEPRYPEIARRSGVGGDVVLRVVVEPNGSVGKIEIVSGAPFGLTNAAVDAVGRWIYRPARIGTRPVPVWKVVRVRFSVSG